MAEYINEDDIVSEDSSEYISEADIASVDEPQASVGKTRSAALGATQGLSMGFGDEIHGANNAIVQKIANVTGIPIPDVSDMIAKGVLKLGDMVTGSDYAENSGDVKWFEPGAKTASAAYTESRDVARSQNAQAAEANPLTYRTAEFAGAVAPSIALPGIRATQGASTLGKVANAAATGASQGALYGAGTSEAEDVGGIAADTGKGAAIGGLLGGGFQAAAPVVKKVAGAGANLLRDLAETQAYRAVGGTKAMGNQLAKRGLSERDIGEFALDEGIVSPFRSTETMLTKTGGIQNEAGAALDDIYRQIDAIGGSQVTPADLVTQLNQLRAPNAVPGSIQQIRNDALDMAESMIAQSPTDANGFITAESLRTLRQAIDENINFAKVPGSSSFGKHDALRDARNVVKDSVSDSITDPAELARFNESNHRFRLASETDDLLQNRIRQQDGNNTIGLRDAAAGAAGMAHSPVGAVAGVLGSKLSRDYGNAVTATALNNISQGLRYAQKAAGSVSADALGQIGNVAAKPVTSSDVEKDAQYMLPADINVPVEMEEKPFAAVVNLLNQTDPEFRKRAREDNE